MSLPKAGVQKIQGFTLQLQHAVKQKYARYFGKQKVQQKSIYTHHGEILIQALHGARVYVRQMCTLV